jgi:hypothetical protein
MKLIVIAVVATATVHGITTHLFVELKVGVGLLKSSVGKRVVVVAGGTGAVQIQPMMMTKPVYVEMVKFMKEKFMNQVIAMNSLLVFILL